MSTMTMARQGSSTAVLDPDAELVARARDGDRSAFEVLFRRHYRQVYLMVARILGDRDEAEDAVQDAFVRAFGALSGFRGEAAFGTWLCRIAINTALRRARRAQGQPLSFADITPESAEQDPPDPADLQLLVEQRANADAVRSAVAALPPKHRLVVSLRYFDGYSCDEIAHVLGCSVGTVWSRLHHAHRKLRRRLSWLAGGEQ